MFFHLRDQSLVVRGVVEETSVIYWGCLLVNCMDALAVSLPARLSERLAARVEIDLASIFILAERRFWGAPWYSWWNIKRGLERQ